MGLEPGTHLVRRFMRTTDVAAVAMSCGGTPVAASDTCSREIEAWQFVCGEGPAIGAYRTGQLVADTTNTYERWLWAGERLYQCGFGAVAAFPLVVDATCIGALTFYQRDRGPMPVATCRRVQRCTSQAVRWMTEVLLSDPGGELHQYNRVHQATGVVMAQSGLDAADSLATIRAYCYATHRGFHDVAEEVLSLKLVLV